MATGSRCAAHDSALEDVISAKTCADASCARAHSNLERLRKLPDPRNKRNRQRERRPDGLGDIAECACVRRVTRDDDPALITGYGEVQVRAARRLVHIRDGNIWICAVKPPVSLPALRGKLGVHNGLYLLDLFGRATLRKNFASLVVN